ncbi:DUF4177 domain-containing protein [Schlesneria paludicola]|uniref:DUF4177 domain-containing protein n=1 Tax=Schlesneria paludicola TaxID=360056 RepID=UPI00029B5700|nr:DUF4177 domain-containing protein [Schlesneria paludicola]
MSTQWEYQTLKLQTEFGYTTGTDFDSSGFQVKLNQHGEQGWELVSVCPIEKVRGGAKFLIAVMKRPR